MDFKDAMNEAFDEFLDSVSETAQDAVADGVTFAVDDSPVDTGRFKGNWYAVVDSESNYRNEDKYDPSGDSTTYDAYSKIEQFDAKKDDFIYVYNNVSDGEEDYASTVSFNTNEARARGIMEDFENITASLIVQEE